MLPSFFVAHGSPMLALEQNPYTEVLGQLGATLHPRGIVLFSAHWESREQQVGAALQPRTIYDFGGFPRALYEITYPATGDAGLAAQVSSLLAAASIRSAVNTERGLDHGAWVVARLLYPDAAVPIVTMSVNPDLAPAEQYQIGRALASLRAQDILIIGSGGTVHNFATMRMGAPAGQGAPWAVAFDDWVLARAQAWDLESLFDYERRAPQAQLAVPPGGREHFVPLLYAMGAADDQRVARELHRSYQYSSLSHALWQFGS